jgi:zinc protease
MSRLLAALGTLLASAALAAEPGVHREVPPGGLELVVIPVRGAATTSLRYVVRAGSMMDPPGRDGLAHLLEHLLVRGSTGSPSLVETVRGAGATLNAFTNRETTTFALDAPSEAFASLAERYLRAVTNPVFRPAEIERELGVIGQEGARTGGGLWAYVEESVYRSQPVLGSTLGGAAARRRISRTDLVEFYQRHFATANTTVVLAGDVTVETARQLVDLAVLVPPSLPGEVVPEDHATCRSLAGVIELRLFLALHVREPQLRSISVDCYTLRGTQFLLAFGYAPTLEATDLPEVMERIFREAGTVPPGERERSQLEKRFGRERERALYDPMELADSAAGASAYARSRTGIEVPILVPRRASIEAMRAAVRRSFVPERRVLLQLSPFEG